MRPSEAQTRTEALPLLDHTEVVDEEAVDPTCTELGMTKASHCDVCGKVLSEREEILALGHDWGDATYEWSEDNQHVTAKLVCKRDEMHEVIETVNTSSEPAAAPTYFEMGKTTYTAEFENELFTEQSKTVDNIPMLEKDAEVKEAEAKIKALSESAGLDDAADVASARAAYDALTDDQKALVSDDVLAKLKEAETSVKAAEEAAAKQAADEKAAQAVADAIAKLSSSAGLDDKEAVEAARKAYDALTEDQKKLVDAGAVTKLATAEASVKTAEEEAAKQPTAAPTAAPTEKPTEAPTAAPTAKPTEAPTAAPTEQPAPTAAPLKNIADCAITVEDQTYTGKALTPAVTVQYGETTLVPDTDYTVAYANNKAAGIATATVTGIGGYTGSKDVNFSIAAVKMSKLTYTVKNQTYTGKALKPAVTVKFGKTKLKKGTDYTVTYKNNKKIGTATVTVKGKGNFTGTKKVTFKINPKGTAFSKLTGGSKQITLKWKNPKNITGYEIQYSLKKNFSSKKTVKIKKAKTLTTTIKKLTAGKKYYVRIRTYKVVSKKTYYSAWSKVKTVKVKGASANAEVQEQDTEVQEQDTEDAVEMEDALVDLEIDDEIGDGIVDDIDGELEVGLLDNNSKNYIAVVQYRRRLHTTSVDEPIDPSITDVSYDPNSTVKEITQQQKTLSQSEMQSVIRKYEAGASTYELADEFGCHRSTISAALKRNGVVVTKRKVDIAVAIKMYESGKTTTEIAKFFDTNGSVVSKTLRQNGVKMRKSWEYPHSKK